jgi:ketosteroid isomerase-like protein
VAALLALHSNRRAIVSLRLSTAAVLLGCISLAACRIERTPRPAGADPVSVARAEIDLTLRTYQEALLAGDARRAAAVFAIGAQLYLPDTADIRGRGEIDQAMANRFASGRVIGMAMESDEIDVGAGIANQFGRYRQQVRDSAGVEHEVNGRFAVRWVRAADSAWRIERLLLNRAPTDSAALAQR